MSDLSMRGERLRVAVLCGGNSAERAVSLRSGEAVTKALLYRGHEVRPVDPAAVDVRELDWSEFDVAFLALHGTGGEDGEIQRTLDELGVTYTGCDSEVSRIAFSKTASKELFLKHGVPTPAWTPIHEADDAARIEQQARTIGFPLVVKPDAQGSSLGVTIVRTAEELPRALTRCFHYDAFGLLEAAVPGTEWTLGVIDDDPLPLMQIVTPRAFYDYEAKYDDEQTQYLFDFDLPAAVPAEITSAALRACTALRTRGLVRVDLRVDRMNRPWVLEVNTIPGMTDHSLVPKAAARTGLNFGELCDVILRRALHPVAAASVR